MSGFEGMRGNSGVKGLGGPRGETGVIGQQGPKGHSGLKGSKGKINYGLIGLLYTTLPPYYLLTRQLFDIVLFVCLFVVLISFKFVIIISKFYQVTAA